MLTIARRRELERKVKAASTNCNDFIEATMRDNHGRRMVQAEIHRFMQDWVDEQFKLGYQYLIIDAPFGHGKSEQFSTGRVAHEIGKNPELRAKVICNLEPLASKSVGAVRNLILSQEYGLVFPGIQPDLNHFGNKSFRVRRRGTGREPTMDGWGVFSSGTGGRCDFMVWDDMCDMNNSVLSPNERIRTYDTLAGVWLPRLEPDGRMIVIKTVWHEDDAGQKFIKTPGFRHLLLRINKAMTAIEVYVMEKQVAVLPLWESKWPRSALQKKRDVMKEGPYARGFELRPYSDKNKTFPSFLKCVKWGEDPSANIPENATVLGGCDLSGESRMGTILGGAAIFPQPGTQKIVRRLVYLAGEYGVSKLPMRIDELISRHHPPVIKVEDNALQSTFVSMLQSRYDGKSPTAVIPTTTTSAKFSVEVGIVSLETQMAAGLWEFPIPYASISDVPPDSVYEKLIREFCGHPDVGDSDTIMTIWFIETAAKQYLPAYEPPPPENPMLDLWNTLQKEKEQARGDAWDDLTF